MLPFFVTVKDQSQGNQYFMSMLEQNDARGKIRSQKSNLAMVTNTSYYIPFFGKEKKANSK
jgi:hypothetical protein